MSTFLADSIISANLTSIWTTLWSFSFSPFITFAEMSLGSRPSYGTSRFKISQSKEPKAKTSTFSSYYLFKKSSGAIQVGVPAYCIDPLPRSAYKNLSVKIKQNTYHKFSQAKIANFDIHSFVDKNIMAFYISMHDTQMMHILKNLSSIPGNFHSLFDVKIKSIFLHVQKIK